MIEDYLAELLAHLRLPSRRRRRIAAEVEDHLACAAAELHAGGLGAEQAEREAIRRFGPAPALAWTFVEQEAARSGLRAAQAGGLLGALTGLLLTGPLFQAAFPSGLAAFVLAQVALVAGGLTFVRGSRCAPDGGPRGVRLSLVLRGTSVVLACAVAGVMDGLVHALTRGGADTWSALAILAVVSAWAAVALTRGWLRARVAPSAPDEPQDALVDIQAAIGLALARVGPRVPALRTPLRLAPILSRWLDPCRHPWRFAVVVSCAAGLALAAGHGLSEGVSVHHVGTALLAGGLIAAIEALAALVGFALLGRFLGLRPSR